MSPSACPFFRDWSPALAYVLGYWFADGNMYHQASAGGYVVSIGSKDVAHLACIRDLIGVGSLTRITGSAVFKLVICRKEVFVDLARLGGTERKSLTLTWPAVPAAYLGHFVRGYVDGDGCLTWNKPNNSVIPMITVAGTPAFLMGMSEAIYHETGIVMPRCHRNPTRRVASIAWFGLAAKCLAYWLYKLHAGVALERKQQIATQFLGWAPRKYFRHRITPLMRATFNDLLPEE